MGHETLWQSYKDKEGARDALRKTIEQSAQQVESNVLIFVLVVSYLILTLMTTDDYAFIDLNRTTTLPILNIAVPIVGFFVAAPILLVAVHFQLLFTLNQHTTHLKDYVGDASQQEMDTLPASIANALPRLSGYSYMGVLFFQRSVVVLLTFTFLIVIQYRISAFRNIPITLLQTVLVFLDLLLIRAFWATAPPSPFGQSPTHWTFRYALRVLRGDNRAGSVLMIGLWMLSLINIGALLAQDYLFDHLKDTPMAVVGRHAVDRLDLERRKVLSGNLEDRIGSEEADLRGRDLSFSNLKESDMAGVDLSDGHLRKANMSGINISHAILSRVDMRDANLTRANLRNSDLRGADLRGADLFEADLTGADLRHADLSGANLNGTTLHGANFTDALLVGTFLADARGVATLFTGAKLTDAQLRQSSFQFSSFSSTDLEDAELSFAYLHGSDFMGANLIGAQFRYAQLQAAYMGFVSVHKTDFSGSEVHGLVFQPTEDGDHQDLIMTTPADQKTRLNWDQLVEAQGSRLPKETQGHKPYIFFEAMVSVARNRDKNQTPVHFDPYIRDSTPEPNETDAKKTHMVIRVLTSDQPGVEGPLARRAREFSRQHDRVQVIVEGASEMALEAKVRDDLETQKRYHGYVIMPNWMTALAADSLLMDLSEWVTADRHLDFTNIMPLFRYANACFESGGNRKRVFAVPLDGNVLLQYYNTNLISKDQIPRTWTEYLTKAESLNRPDRAGSVIANSPMDQGPYIFWSIAHSLLQARGLQQGSFFDGDTMEPLVDNEAFREALSLFAGILAQGPRDEEGNLRLNLNAEDAQRIFSSGRAALTIALPDLGTQQAFRDNGGVAAAIVPGSRHILDRKTGKLTPVTQANAPHSLIYNHKLVNHAPYAAQSGWSGAIRQSATEEEREWLFRFLVYLSRRDFSQEDVTVYGTEFNPYRLVHIHQNNAWEHSEINPEFLSGYLLALRNSLENPNLVMDLQIDKAEAIIRRPYAEVIFPILLQSQSVPSTQTLDEIVRGVAALMTSISEATPEDLRKDYLGTLALTACPDMNEEP